ncbi:hypothetical protein Pelo_871 [Pelomyxa schiedti]|nr:hypothetical protein Pelo_871 [Pelomyxa schiedti]
MFDGSKDLSASDSEGPAPVRDLYAAKFPLKVEETPATTTTPNGNRNGKTLEERQKRESVSSSSSSASASACPSVCSDISSDSSYVHTGNAPTPTHTPTSSCASDYSRPGGAAAAERRPLMQAPSHPLLRQQPPAVFPSSSSSSSPSRSREPPTGPLTASPAPNYGTATPPSPSPTTGSSSSSSSSSHGRLKTQHTYPPKKAESKTDSYTGDAEKPIMGRVDVVPGAPRPSWFMETRSALPDAPLLERHQKEAHMLKRCGFIMQAMAGPTKLESKSSASTCTATGTHLGASGPTSLSEPPTQPVRRQDIANPASPIRKQFSKWLESRGITKQDLGDGEQQILLLTIVNLEGPLSHELVQHVLNMRFGKTHSDMLREMEALCCELHHSAEVWHTVEWLEANHLQSCVQGFKQNGIAYYMLPTLPKAKYQPIMTSGVEQQLWTAISKIPQKIVPVQVIPIQMDLIDVAEDNDSCVMNLLLHINWVVHDPEPNFLGLKDLPSQEVWVPQLIFRNASATALLQYVNQTCPSADTEEVQWFRSLSVMYQVHFFHKFNVECMPLDHQQLAVQAHLQANDNFRQTMKVAPTRGLPCTACNSWRISQPPVIIPVPTDSSTLQVNVTVHRALRPYLWKIILPLGFFTTAASTMYVAEPEEFVVRLGICCCCLVVILVHRATTLGRPKIHLLTLLDKYFLFAVAVVGMLIIAALLAWVVAIYGGNGRRCDIGTGVTILFLWALALAYLWGPAFLRWPCCCFRRRRGAGADTRPGSVPNELDSISGGP